MDEITQLLSFLFSFLYIYRQIQRKTLINTGFKSSQILKIRDISNISDVYNCYNLKYSKYYQRLIVRKII